MNPKTERELNVFQTKIDPSPDKKHMVSVTWSPENVCIYFDGKLQQEIHPDDLQ